LVHEHLDAHRAWLLVRDNGTLKPTEQWHLEACDACRDWLQVFLDMARRAGFKLSIDIPLKKTKSTGTNG
jgi:hypothetical protein